MFMRKPLIPSLLVASLLIATAGASTLAAAHVDVRISLPPPALIYEVAPAPRYGNVWVPGYWQARAHKHGSRHQWVTGYWLPARHGYAYRQPQWVQRSNYWVQEPGRWDRDHHGVPNRHDRYSNNFYRR